MTADDQLKADLLEEATDEPLDLFHAIALVKIVEGGEGRLPLLRRTAPLIVDLVREGRLVCGDWDAVGRGVFAPWSSSAGHAAEVVEEYVRRVLHGEQTFIPDEPCLFARPEHVEG
jgi:hypothetical protein